MKTIRSLVNVIANKEKDLFINEQIRAKEVMVIGPNGEQLGIKSIKDAITATATYTAGNNVSDYVTATINYGSSDSGNTGDGGSGIDGTKIDLSTLPTSGTFAAAGFTQKVLNFQSGGDNSSTSHSIGTSYLS